MAPVTFRSGSSSLGAASSRRITLSDAQPRMSIDLDAPRGSDRIRATLANLSDPDAQVELYLFYDPPEKGPKGYWSAPILRGSAYSFFGSGAADTAAPTYSQPKVDSGHWRVVVQARRLPQGSVTFDYGDVVANPKYGKVTIDANGSLPATGGTVSLTATVQRGEPVPAGRMLIALPVLTAEQTYAVTQTKAAKRMTDSFRTYLPAWSTITPL
jgi:hypothetical protein